MKLRKLGKKDATFMIEWMHDEFVVCNLKTDFKSKSIEDCLEFIVLAQETKDDLHMAIVDDNDEYMGTVSLKNILNKTAEFAITIRRCAMGQGVSKYGMKEIFRKGIDELKLETIYWCVAPSNLRAVRFYEKNGFKKVPCSFIHTNKYTEEETKAYYWYLISKNEIRNWLINA